MTARILNVDDDEASRYVAGRLLRSAGFEVVDAASGLEALELLESVRPDLMLLDVNLPDLSGYDVCAAVRASPDLANTPVLMLSASFVTGDDRVRGLTGGADAYLAEPVDSTELVAVVNALLRMRRAERDVRELNRILEAKVYELETADARQRLLADLAGILAEELDIERTLEAIAGLAVRHLADWCVIDVMQPDETLLRTAAAHRDPTLQPLADRLRDHQAPTQRSNAVQRALQSGKAVLVSEIAEADRESFRRDPALAALVEQLGIRSYISAPLVARGRRLGVLTLVRASGGPYESADLSAAADLALRAALALDNATLFRAAEEASRAKDHFFAMVSHELRTPLTSIMGWAMVLTKPDLDPETLKVGLGEIDRSAKSQARIIEDLLDSARIAAGKINLELTRVSLDEVVQESVSLVQRSVDAKEIELVSSGDPRAVISGDRQRLVQIVSNLLTNAVKFTPEQGRIEISVSADPASGMATLVVRDNGRGISPQFLPHVFDRFAQQEDGTGGTGMGLGLNIVKSFVELHGGSVGVASEGENKGSQFTVRLPLAP